MDSRHSEHVVLETTATGAVLAAGIAIAALLYQLITVVVPVLESMVFPRVAAASSQEVTTGARRKRWPCSWLTRTMSRRLDRFSPVTPAKLSRCT